MDTRNDIVSRLDSALRSNIGEAAAAIAGLNEALRAGGASPDVLAMLDRLGAVILKSRAPSEVRDLLEAYASATKRIDLLEQEKRRLEALYAAGIQFSSEKETRSLVAKAIDIVVREVGADAGFIVLVDEVGNIESTFSRNIDPETDAGAQELSRGVIAATLEQSKPTQVDRSSDDELLRRNSVVRLGINAALCVPLVNEKKLFGVVYLDRRTTHVPFTETDLAFVLSFARQIVRGIVTSGELFRLQNQLVADASMRFADLRMAFQCPDIIGSSRVLFDVLKMAHKISGTDAPVILLGENGTGKDLLAQAIHQNSKRSAGPFVVIDCGAIPADLLESELFGYEAGAFTGASKTKPGKLERADGGTVFFDEIGELPLALQAKLLRVLQKREIERLGGSRSSSIDVRFLAATNRDIGAMVTAGTFREDLYYRLKVIELVMPSLRERKEDIAELAGYFAAKHAQQHAAPEFDADVVPMLEHYDWPGNIRELQNVIHRAIVLSRDGRIGVHDLPPEITEAAGGDSIVPPGKLLGEAEAEFRRLYIIRTLRQTGSVAEAAKVLGLNRTHFYRLLSQLGIEY